VEGATGSGDSTKVNDTAAVVNGYEIIIKKI
jgi:hypothetical protein